VPRTYTRRLDYQQAESLYNTGMGLRAVAKAIGCSISTLRTRVLVGILDSNRSNKSLYTSDKEQKAAGNARYYALHRDAVVKRVGDHLRANPEKRARYLFNYRCSDKGKAMLQRRHDRLGSNNCYRDTASYWIFVEERPCAACGETDKSLLQCDHITPRAAGGTDDPWNLQILCKKCHRQKTKEDIILMRKAGELQQVGVS
jgi:5-methylcytosine-specific restriction endonuclease McrA